MAFCRLYMIVCLFACICVLIITDRFNIKLVDCGFTDCIDIYWIDMSVNIVMLRVFRRKFVDLPINYSLSYYWSSGFTLSMFVGLQVISGIILSLLYIAEKLKRFFAVIKFNMESFFTWCVRYWHVWGVKVIFMLLFVHMGRALYYSRYSKGGVWHVGILLYILIMIEAFTGYVLPWHQMSYWAATVLTSIIESIPFVGPIVYRFIVGGFFVRGDTLIRMFSLHICIGFLLIGLMVVHLIYLHMVGSNNPLGIISFGDIVFFHSYYTVKDLVFFLICILFMVRIMWIAPDLLMGVENYMEINVMSTPISIKPEWYFLMFFSMIRCMNTKLGGISFVLSFLFFVWIPTHNYVSSYFIGRQLLFWIIINLFFMLIYLGMCHSEYPYLNICRVCRVLLMVLMFAFKLFWVCDWEQIIYLVK